MSRSGPLPLVERPAGSSSLESRYDLPEVEPDVASEQELSELRDQLVRLKQERGAVVMAHNYQRGEVQDASDFVGDSLQLAQRAADSDAQVIVLCGVHFMAETAAILNPQRTVLLPDLRAGCSLAASITPRELRAAKQRHPDAVVVSYVNTTAEIKAESDYCCTSSNAAQVVRAIPADKPILFLPDQFLAAVVAAETGRDNILAYPGYCHVHRMIDPEDVMLVMHKHPEIELLLHPECGCVSSCMQKAAEGLLPRDRTYFLSTGAMQRHIDASPAREFAIGTELGMLHRLRQAHPDRSFLPVNGETVCAFMKTITLRSVVRSLERLEHRISVPEATAARARRAIDRMLALS